MKFLVIYVAKMHSLLCLHPPDISAMAWERTNWTLGNSPSYDVICLSIFFTSLRGYILSSLTFLHFSFCNETEHTFSRNCCFEPEIQSCKYRSRGKGRRQQYSNWKMPSILHFGRKNPVLIRQSFNLQQNCVIYNNNEMMPLTQTKNSTLTFFHPWQLYILTLLVINWVGDS